MSAEDAAAQAAKLAAQHGIDLSKLPKSLDMNAETITDNVHIMNQNCVSLPCFLPLWS